MERIVEKMNHKVFDFALRLSTHEFENRKKSINIMTFNYLIMTFANVCFSG
jgi:hypothetical protein